MLRLRRHLRPELAKILAHDISPLLFGAISTKLTRRNVICFLFFCGPVERPISSQNDIQMEEKLISTL